MFAIDQMNNTSHIRSSCSFTSSDALFFFYVLFQVNLLDHANINYKYIVDIVSENVYIIINKMVNNSNELYSFHKL